MWKLCDRESFERLVIQTFPKVECLAKMVVERFEADIRMFREATDQQLRQIHVWKYGRVTVRYRFLPGMKLVEVVSVGAGRTTVAAGRPIGRSRGHTDFFLFAILIGIVSALILSSVIL